MSAYFNLTLDTTAPTLGVFAPTAVYLYEYFLVYVESNEALDAYQKIYFEDTVGIRTYITLLQTSPTEYEGIGQIQTATSGGGTLVVTLRDPVLNETEVRTPMTIFATDKQSLVINIQPKLRILTSIIKKRNKEIVQGIRKRIVNMRPRKNSMSKYDRTVNIKPEEKESDKIQ